MKKNKTKNPLIKRVPRELKGDWSKYLLVSLFMIFVIGCIAGMYVANESMLTAATENMKKSICEDGHFELSQKAKKGTFDSLSATIYEDFYYNLNEDKDGDGKKEGTIRVFQKNDEVNLASVLDGRLPENKNEIAIDRMHADNAGIKVGDTISTGGEKYEVSGLIAYVNYATLHEKSTDLMFDAIKFGVAIATEDAFDAYGTDNLHYSYSWKYEKTPADDTEAKEKAEDFISRLCSGETFDSLYLGVLSGAIRFVEKGMDTNKARWQSSPFWVNFLKGIESIKLKSHEVTPEIGKTIDWIDVSVLGSLKLLSKVAKEGNIDLYQIMENSDKEISERHKMLFNSFEMLSEEEKNNVFDKIKAIGLI